ncbi:MAG: type II toxin-antitoxin system RelE/ParE family toxin [Gemmataceae bacterium]|nr:type II toxin-antitoxin system RelE/ParE family toxin [Gemmataceae bacterium]
MIRRVRILQRVYDDAEAIFDWLAIRSEQGANRWRDAFFAAVQALSSDADIWSSAPEAARVRTPIRQKFFKTPHGRQYRILYRIDPEEVVVLRVRAPGEPPLSRRDLQVARSQCSVYFLLPRQNPLAPGAALAIITA